MTLETSGRSAEQAETDDAIGAFAERILAATLGAQQLQALYLGERLGWYRALADEGPLTSVELASRTGTSERYAREWLEHQAVTGYLSVEAAAGESSQRAYRLPDAHAEVLLNDDSLAYLAPLARMQAAAGLQLTNLLDAYRTGGGVSWAQFGDDAREAQAAANRPVFLHQLAQEFLPAIPGLHEALTAGATVADVGCGEGWSSIGIALGYPASQVDGLDADAPSIAAARRHAAASDVQDRVRFETVDVAGTTLIGADGQPVPDGVYDAVFAFECVHDVPDPAGFLATMNRLAAPGGYVIVVDERTQDELTLTPVDDAGGAPARGSDLEQLLYGWSLTICLPDGMAHQPSAGTGTVLRPSTLTKYAQEAGFSRVEVLPIEHDTLRFYRLHR